MAAGGKRPAILLGLVLLAATGLVYARTVNFDFLIWDDPIYVMQNPQVQDGLSAENVRWALTADRGSNWHPLTWISHMLDSTLFGISPGAHHAVNVLFHLLNTALLFALLYACTGGLWRSGLVAALFALHPLHVESVAWVSERKDVLSTLFWLLTMWAYTSWTRTGGAARYLLVVLSMAAGLLAKPMLVTLPLVLLLWDIWPLGRLRNKGTDLFSRSENRSVPLLRSENRSVPLLRVWEKVPLFALSLLSGIVTLTVQRGAMEAAVAVPPGSRMANAVVSYVRYIVKTIWPHDLSPFYAHPNLAGGTPWSVWQIAGAVVVLAGISVVVVRSHRDYLLVGWSWYLITLLPVIGLVQVGRQAMADRYTYVPLIGLFVMAVWGAAELIDRLRVRRPWAPHLAATVAAVLVLACGTTTARQVGYWRDSVTLFRHALEAGPATAEIHGKLAMALVLRGEAERAIPHYDEALQLDPNHFESRVGLADALRDTGQTDQAILHYREALRIVPDSAPAHNNLGVVLLLRERPDEARRHFARALELAPGMLGASRNLSDAEHRIGLRHYRGEGVERDPAQAAVWFLRAAERGNARAQFDLAVLYELGEGVPQDDLAAVAWHGRAAMQGQSDAQCNLGVMYVQGKGVPPDPVEAARWFRLSAEQGYPQCQFNLGRMYFLGHGVEPSDVLAHAWFALAADAGEAAAGEWRDRSAARMSPAQLADARRRRAEFESAVTQARNRR